MTPTPADLRRFLDVRALARLTTILLPPPELGRALQVGHLGALILWPLEAVHLVKGATLEPFARLAVTWSGAHGLGYRLDAVAGAWAVAERQGQPQAVPVLELAKLTTAELHGRRAVLEAVAVAVRFQLEATAWRLTGTGPEPRRVRACKLDTARQLLVAEDLDRQAPRAFKLADLVGLELAGGHPAPAWLEGVGYSVDRRGGGR